MGRALSARRSRFCQGREPKGRPKGRPSQATGYGSRRESRCSASLTESIRSPNSPPSDECRVAISRDREHLQVAPGCGARWSHTGFAASMPLLAIRWTSRSRISRPPQVRGPGRPPPSPFGRRPASNAGQRRFCWNQDVPLPSPLSSTAQWRVIRGMRVKIAAELRDKFAAAALKWPDTGLQLPAR